MLYFFRASRISLVNRHSGSLLLQQEWLVKYSVIQLLSQNQGLMLFHGIMFFQKLGLNLFV